VLAPFLALMVAAGPADVPLDIRSFQVVKQSSGPDDYYRIETGPDGAYLHAAYKPPMDTTVHGIEAPARFKRSLQGVRWRWRVNSFPKGGDECNPEVGDAAAGVFVSFKAGLKIMVIKYVWNTTGKVGKTCELANNPFFAKRIIVLRVAGAPGTWHTEEVDPRADFVRYFGGKREDVPDFIGLAVLSDGDATKSLVEADYGDFALLAAPPAGEASGTAGIGSPPPEAK
jgi:Protein of unknown function (DUF3047)